MKNFTQYSIILIGVGFLVSCGSMHPPTTNPYYPGYHARDAQEVEEEYQDWEEEQAMLEERAQIQDSLRNEYREQYRESILSGGMNFNQYNFYGNRYPFYSHNPYYYRSNRWHHPYYRRNYRTSFYFSYSNQPVFVDSWWADDYLWDQYYGGWNRYNYNYYSPWYYSSGYYYDPWYDYGYGHWYHDYYYVVDGEQQPDSPRPVNRDRFSRSVSSNGSNASIGSSPSGRAIGPRPESRGRKLTPAVIDRDRLRQRTLPQSLQRPVTRGRAEPRSSDDNTTNRRVRSRTYSPPASSSSSGSSGSSSKSARRSSSSSKSSDSGSSSDSDNQRPKNRRR